MKLNDRSVTGTSPVLPEGKKEYIFFDETIRGFGLRVREGGSRTWVYQYWRNGKARRMSLGSWPTISAHKAREMIEQLAAQVVQGHDPASEKQERLNAPKRETFGSIVEKYLAVAALNKRRSTLSTNERNLRTHAKPLHRLEAEAIEVADISKLLTDLAQTSGKITANR